jgi:hypothetical protein
MKNKGFSYIEVLFSIFVFVSFVLILSWMTIQTSDKHVNAETSFDQTSLFSTLEAYIKRDYAQNKISQLEVNTNLIMDLDDGINKITYQDMGSYVLYTKPSLPGLPAIRKYFFDTTISFNQGTSQVTLGYNNATDIFVLTK